MEVNNSTFEIGFDDGMMWITVNGVDVNMGSVEDYHRMDIEELKLRAWHLYLDMKDE